MNVQLKKYVAKALTDLMDLGVKGKVDFTIYIKPRWDKEKETYLLEVQSHPDSTASCVKFSVEI